MCERDFVSYERSWTVNSRTEMDSKKADKFEATNEQI